MSKLTLLGWGSLCWDVHPWFDCQHGAWDDDGPILNLEFSRVSRSRSGALTLVVDPVNGTPCRVAYAMYQAVNLDSAIVALQRREGTTPANIGLLDLESDRRRSRYPATIDAIRPWATEKNFDTVIWTDLPSNFLSQTGVEFTVPAALAYLETLSLDAKEIAYAYLRRAPAAIQTPLRRALYL